MVRTYVRKTLRTATWTKDNMRKAMDAIKSNEMGYLKASKIFKIPKTTLIRRVKNDSSEKRMGRFKTVFNAEQEKELIEHLLEFEKRFFGMSTRDVRALAYELAETNKLSHAFDKEKKMAGKDWLYHFQKRHPEIVLRNPEHTSKARAQAFNKPVVSAYFELLTQVFDEYHFSPTKVFNVDETGVTTVQTKSSKVFALKGRKQVGTLTSAERGVLSTAVICMSASGYFVPPMLIFPRKRMKIELMDGAPPGSTFACHPSGWMQTEIFTDWFRHFLKNTKPTKEEPVLLILDGHVTHTKNIAFIKMARDNHVTVLCLPPHCTHKLQPLDVSFMGPLNTFFSQEIEKFLRQHPSRVVSQFQIASLFGKAYLKAAVPNNAINGFRKTGIFPVDPHVFSEEDYVAAETTNIELPQHVVADSLEEDETEAQFIAEERREQIYSASSNTSGTAVITSNESLQKEPGISGNNPEINTSTSSFPLKGVSEVQAIPKASSSPDMRRKNRKKGKSAILTSSPYKNELEQNQLDKSGIRKVLKPVYNKTNDKMKIKTRIKKNAKPKSEEQETDDEDCPCLYCREDFSKSVKGEGWIQCCKCKNWAHEECAGCEEIDEFFFCENCSQL